MRQIIFSVMITCWAAPLAAQQLYTGMGLGFRQISSGRIVHNGITMEVNNPNDRHFLVPYLGMRKSLGKGWHLGGELFYESGGMSFRVADPSPPACVLCPLWKGTLVGYSELLTGISAGYRFIDRDQLSIEFSSGFLYAYRFALRQSPTEGLTYLSPEAKEMLAAAAGTVRRSYWNGLLRARLSWRRWSLSYDYIFLVSESTADKLILADEYYNLTITQYIQRVGMAYLWGRN